jgi:hypothetical protein
MLLPAPFRPSSAMISRLFWISERRLISSIISLSLTSFLGKLYQKSITMPVCETLILILILRQAKTFM